MFIRVHPWVTTNVPLLTELCPKIFPVACPHRFARRCSKLKCDMYKILGADRKEYGPVSADVVRQWIAERRANAQTRIQAEGSSEWKPLSDFPEFSEALKAGPAPPPLGAGAIPRPLTGAVPAQTSGLATASLVLGILGLFSCGLTSLLGLIMGVLALTKIRNSNGQLSGSGVAIAGICVSAALTLFGLAFGAALLLPALAQAKSKAQSITCINQLKQIGLAARMWSNDHNDTFPPDFLSMSNELASPKVLTCPADRRRTAMLSWSDFDPKNVTYEYLTPSIKDSPSLPQTVVFRCPIHGAVCFGDGSVQQRGKNAGRPAFP